MRDKKIFGFSLGFSTGWGSYGCGCDGGGSRLEVGMGVRVRKGFVLRWGEGQD